MQSILEILFPIVILIGGVLLATRFLVGKRVFEEAAGHWLYDISKAAVRLPFRILSYLFARVVRLIRLMNHKL